MGIFTQLFIGVEAIYWSITLILFALSPIIPAAGFYARIFIATAILIGCALYGCFASITVRLFGYGGLGQWLTARAFKWSMWLIMGITFKVEGEEHLKNRPAVLVGNHQTSVQ